LPKFLLSRARVISSKSLSASSFSNPEFIFLILDIKNICKNISIGIPIAVFSRMCNYWIHRTKLPPLQGANLAASTGTLIYCHSTSGC